MQRNRVLSILVITIGLLAAASAWTQSKTDKPQANDDTKAIKPLVTFVELGSVKCIPCRQMQPVMKAIEEKYGIKVIPTQVFLDQDGKEFFRHEGFLPEAEIDKLLQKRGLNARSGG